MRVGEFLGQSQTCSLPEDSSDEVVWALWMNTNEEHRPTIHVEDTFPASVPVAAVHWFANMVPL